MQGIATEAATEEKPAAQKDSVPKVIYHVAQKDLWQAALNCSKPYYPPTYEADGFIHATADPNLLLVIQTKDVLNNFYKTTPGEFLCLEIDTSKLRSELKIEGAAPVGNIPASDEIDKLVQFPHIYGPIQPIECISKIYPVERESDGTFMSIQGVCSVK